MEKVKKLFIEHPLLIILVLYCLLSCFAILNAAPLITKVSSPYTLWRKQLIFYLLSVIIIFIVYYIGNDVIYDHIELFYYICLFLLFLLAFDHIIWSRVLGKHIVPFAHDSGGATMWFNLPGFSLQPSEFMKIILVILLAKVTKQYNDKMLIRTFQTELSYLLKVLKYVIPPVLFTYLQNDTGVVMIMLVGVFFIVFSSGLRKEWFLVIFGAVGLVILVGTYLFLYQHDIFTTIVTGHKLDRLYGWIDPEGTVSNQGMQLFYALISYGSGGLTGHGFQAVIKSFPEAQTDFIFAVILTDYGFVGGFITILLVIALDVTILKIGLDSSNGRDKYFAMGIFGLLIFQQVWNMGMILGLLPITGITLPLISYGGSSLLSYMLTVGMFLDINHQSNIIKNKLT